MVEKEMLTYLEARTKYRDKWILMLEKKNSESNAPGEILCVGTEEELEFYEKNHMPEIPDDYILYTFEGARPPYFEYMEV